MATASYREDLGNWWKECRSRKVRCLVSRAANRLRDRDFEEAAEICRRVLEIRPDHRVARYWLAEAEWMVSGKGAFPRQDEVIMGGELESWEEVKGRKGALHGVR